MPEFPALQIKNGDVSPELLYYRIKQKKINIDDYESIHVVSCYSGDSGAGSFANNLAALTGLPVKGYIGRVVSQVSEHSASLDDIRLHGIYRENKFKKGSAFHEQFEYKPVWYSVL